MNSRTGLLFALPALIVLAMLIAYPVAYTGLLSVTDSQGEFVGIKNFAAVLKPRVTTQAFVNTILWVAGSIVFQVLFGVATAILLNQTFAGRGVLRSIALIPWVIPGIVAATTWAWMFHTEFGIINYMLTGPGILDAPVNWLTNKDTVLPVVIAINVWKLFPFVAIMVLAGLQAIPNDLYEAARVDGANSWQRFWKITLPLLSPTTFFVFVVYFIGALQMFVQAWILTQAARSTRP
jgi:multiple sugar transport system permease protein